MDSMPLACLPKGSVVSVLQSKVSTRYDILARRILVRHVSKNLVTNSEIVSEGWASVQSSQGYVILSPLVALCYNNTRWGSSRPIVKQCGHAAHLKCVETHTLSLHHRAAGDQPYDGRFAANINDGEFLCPLCKQLSNILIPRDGMSAISTIEASNSVDVSTRQPIRSIRNLLSRARSVSLSPIERRALEDFGSHLYAAMCVSWERVTIAQKATQERWHTAIKLWDYEESDSLSKSTDKIGVKNILRLFRQQLIAWAAVGHSAAALEASARGLEDALPFGIVSSTFDPWLEYGDDSYMTHPMLLELKRTLTGCAGLYEVLTIELSQLLAGREMNSDERTVVGSSIANILEGKSWLLDSEVETSTKSGSTELWAELNALISAIPSHVARDGSITSRCEARATAAAMWAVKGLGCDATSKTEPPAPLVIKQLFASDHLKFPAIPPKWGTLDPFVTVSDEMHHVPFRLGVACGFLYTPLLAWDLCTFTGSALSCVLSNSDAELPNSGELLQLAHTLLIGRIIQAIITPHGIDIPHEDDLDGEECWTASDAAAEGLALTRLVAHCRGMVQAKALALPHSLLGSSDTLSPLSLLAGVGRAILPFSRSLVLMLRACFAAIHDRQEKMSTDAKSSEKDATFHRVLCNKEIMTFEDGFQIVNAFACPKPSELLNGDWFILVNRWLVASIGFEVHHCSMDRSMTDSDLVSSNPSIVSTSMKRPFEVDQVTNEQPLSDESLDEMVVDIDLTNDDGDDRILAIRNARNEYLGHGDIDDSDDELADSVDEAEEMIGFDNGIGPLFGSNPVEASPTETGESSDMSSASPTYQIALEGEFANVGQSPILPFQPTLLGSIGIGPGRQGSAFEFSNANELMSDMSHLGLVHRKEIPTFTLIRLPQSFVELYNIVNKVKGRDDHGAIDESDDVGSAETAICLLTGAVMRSGSSRRFLSRANPRLPGACTLHARKTASGVGIFFLVQKCTVLLMHNSKSAYSPSLYVDEHGEEDPQLRRGRPLFLNEARYRALEQLWRQQGIPREVAQIRSTSDRVIRDNWY